VSEALDEEDKKHKHVTDQMWIPEIHEDGIYLVAADDRTVVLKMCRPDRGSDLLMAGYVVALQARQILRGPQ
jgi:hypothetical protein